MPGSIIHLQTAYVYAENKNMEPNKRKMLYLGSIAPDAVNSEDHAPKPVRWAAHLRSADLNEWTNNAAMFYKQNSGKFAEGFVEGYFLHILTDILWDRKVNPPLENRLFLAKTAPNRIKEERWKEIKSYENTQTCCNWLAEVKDVLPDAEPESIGTVEKAQLEKWKSIVLSSMTDSGTRPKILSGAVVAAFISDAADECDRLLI